MPRKPKSQPLQAFFIYAHKDERLRDALEISLAVYKREGVISTWYDGKIVPGEEWNRVIKENLRASRVFLLLVSPHFLNSDFINDVEMKYALKMHKKALAVVIPIILKPCDWKRTRLENLQALPKGGRPITLWRNQDQAWADVVQGIRKAVEDFQAKFTSAGATPSSISTAPGTTPKSTQPEITVEASTPTIKSLHQLRAPVADFVGRELEIDHLVKVLSEVTESGKTAIGGIRGMGGLGKSELAYAVSHRLADTFPDAQLLLELRGVSNNPLTPEQALQVVIRAFEPLAQLPSDLDALKGIYITLLTGKRVLILADDAEDAKQVSALLPPPGCALLLTSRQRFNLPGMVTCDLETLPAQEAKELLLEIYPDIDTAAPHMAELCGRLPLALRLSAEMCANSPMSIEYHLKALEKARLELLRDPDNPDDPKTNVEASLRLSYDALDLLVQQVLCQLSVFPASFDTNAASAVVEVPGAEDHETTADPRPLEEMLALLYRRSLLDWDRQTERYSLHDLVRVFALARLEDEDAVRMRHAQHYAQIAALADDLYLKGKENLPLGLKLFDQERANIDTGWNWARARAGSPSQEVYELLLDYANATVHIGALRYDTRQERIPQLNAAVEAARRLSRKGAEGALLSNLGTAYRRLGDARASIQHHEQSLEIARNMGDRQREGNALGSLGNAYVYLGETRRAIEYYEQTLEIAHKLGDRRSESKALGSLGLAYADLGETRKAIQHYEQSLKIAHEIGDRQGESIALGNMGISYKNLGEIHKAIQYYEQYLEVAHELGYRQGEAIASWNLGLLLAEEGNLSRGVELLQVTVDYEREIGHTDAEKDAAIVERYRQRLS
jgi:tetratricopeptide (TPR) repeat protein